MKILLDEGIRDKKLVKLMKSRGHTVLRLGGKVPNDKIYEMRPDLVITTDKLLREKLSRRGYQVVLFPASDERNL